MEMKNLQPLDYNKNGNTIKYKDLDKLRLEKQKLGKKQDPYLIKIWEQFIDELIELGFPIEKIFELVDKLGVYSLDKNFAFEYLST